MCVGGVTELEHAWEMVGFKPKSRIHGDGGACDHLLDDLARGLDRLDRARGLAHQERVELATGAKKEEKQKQKQNKNKTKNKNKNKRPQ